MRKILILCAAVLGVTYSSQAQETKRGCVRDANRTGNQCAIECRQEQADALLLCSAFGDADKQNCLKACSSDKETCLEPFRTEVRGCRDTCFGAFDTSLAACQAACSPNCAGNSAFEVCVDTAKVAKYSCHLACTRSAEDDAAAIRACRATFRACVKTCRA